MTGPVRTESVWLDAAGGLRSWVTAPADGLGTTGVVLLPTVGYAYWTAHRTLRATAEALAALGCTVLRVDHAGTGDSADPSDEQTVQAWHEGLHGAAEALRALGARRIVVGGIGLGAALAAAEAEAVGADALLAIAPAVSGRRFSRELRMMRVEDPAAERTGDGIDVAGSRFGDATLADLAGIDVAKAPPAVARALVVAGPDDAAGPALASALEEAGADVTSAAIDLACALAVPTEDARVPDGLLDLVAGWCGPCAAAGAWPALRAEGRLVHDDGTPLVEDVAVLGPERLVAVRTSPAAGEPRATVLFLNTGSEHHVGPGRVWVDWARALAADGCETFRLDWSGWGESPDLGHAPGRPYDPHVVPETLAVVAALRERSARPLVVVGLCAGAWVALHAAQSVALDGVVAINPQLYWQQGDPVEALIGDTHVRRAPERRREELGARLGLWSALDAAGARHRVARLLRDLDRQQRPALLLFAEGDDGLVFLRTRVGRTLRATAGDDRPLRCVEVPGLDHALHRRWRRDAALAALRAEVEQVAVAAAPAAAAQA